MELTQEEQVIRGDAVARFFNDGTVKMVLVEQTQTYFVEWLRAATPEERELLWAKARALEDLVDALQATVDDGKLATHQVQQATRPT